MPPLKTHHHLLEMRDGNLWNLSRLQPVHRPQVPRPKDAIPPFQWSQALNLSSDSRRHDFESPNGAVTRPYQCHMGKTYMRPTDWTYYHAQDEVNPTEYHPDWPTGLREMGPILVPAGSETSPNQTRTPPLSPIYLGRTLWRKIADIKQQKSWGNIQEQPGILQHMRTTDEAIRNDPDWANTLLRCREYPAEGYLHSVLWVNSKRNSTNG